jgi:hypothetical protein
LLRTGLPAKVLILVLMVIAVLTLRLGWEVLAQGERARPALSTSAVAQKTGGDLAQSEEGLVCEDFADREEAQDEFDSDPGAPDLAALDPTATERSARKNSQTPPAEPPLAVDNPAAPRPALPPNGPRPPLRLLPLLGPRLLPSPARRLRPTKTWASS